MLTPILSTEIHQPPQVRHSQLKEDTNEDGRGDLLSRLFSHYLPATQKVAALMVSGSTVLGGQRYSWA